MFMPIASIGIKRASFAGESPVTGGERGAQEAALLRALLEFLGALLGAGAHDVGLRFLTPRCGLGRGPGVLLKVLSILDQHIHHVLNIQHVHHVLYIVYI